MLVELDNVAFQVWVPHIDSEVKAHTDDDFMNFAVGEFTDGARVASQNLAGCFCVLIEDLWLQVLVLKVVLQDFPLLLLLF
jgi:hypothetical protein